MAPSQSKLNQVKFFIFYFKTGEVKEISKALFSKLSYPVLVIRDAKFRVVGCNSRSEAQGRLSGFRPQGLFSATSKVFSDLTSLGSIIMSALSKISSVSKRDILMITSAFIKVIDMFRTRELSPLSLTSVVLDLYLVYTTFVKLEPQGLECLASLACANFIPDKLFSIIKKSQYLSSVKILDDLSYFHDFIIAIVEAFEWMISKIPIPDICKDFLNSIMLTFRNTSDHLLIRDLELVLKASKDCKVFLDLSFREKSKRLNQKFEASHALKEWTRRSTALQAIAQKWVRHMKVIEAYEDPGRVEPTCFVFEGPPGKKKSVVMNAVVEALGEPFYAHCVKAVMDGKDFYDNYNNEPIFYMDDVGQNGVSQWRPLMNMVSSVKMPLDCAEAQNKDTKFFNSTKIFATTNRFQTLNLALTKQDCIDDIQALWRRGYVFDFSQVISTSNFVSGRLVFKYYNMDTQSFVQAFPPAFVKEMKKRSCLLNPYIDIEDRSQLLVWICKIVKIFDLMKKNYADENRLTLSERDVIKNELANLEFLDAQGQGSYFKDVIESYIADYIALVTTYAFSLKKFVCENAWWFAALGIIGLGLGAVWWFDDKILESDDGFRYISGFYEEDDGTKKMVSVCTDGVNRYFDSDDVNSTSGKPALFDMYINPKQLDYLLAREMEGVDFKELFKPEAFKFDPHKAHNSVLHIQKFVKNVSVKSSKGSISMRALISGRSIILPSHASADDEFSIIIYDDKENNKRLVDGDLVKVIYRNDEEDVMVAKLRESYPSPFKNLSHWFKPNVDFKETAFVVSSEILASAGTFKPKANFTYGTGNDWWTVTNAFIYKLQFNGLCGSVIFSPIGGVFGMHVAGSASSNIGVAMVWSDSTRIAIGKVLEDDKNLLPIDYKSYKNPNSSVIKLDRNMNLSAITNSNIGPSPLYNIYPINRSPAKLDKYGRFTVKEVGKASFAIPGSPPLNELNFSKEVVSTMFGDFSELPWNEVVCGNLLLNRLNKDSSNGYACYPEKDKYIDFEKGELTNYCKEEIDRFEKAVLTGTMKEEDWSKLMWVECPKDEVRNDSKEGVPRTFRVGTIIQQILAKRYFGKFVESVLNNRDFNQVMVGINPIKYWPKMYDKLLPGKVFAGDVAKWDKGMVPEFQRALFDVILSKYKGSNLAVASIVLECLIHSLVIMLDDLFLTTHSLASGHFLTAIFNSLINRMYTAGWYFRYLTNNGLKPKVHEFFQDVMDFVYGDDKLNSVYRHSEILNAITMREYFESLGLGFTDASKQPIVHPFQDISEVSFLKRSFRYHSDLGKVVCPLELDVLQSGLSWVDHTKDIQLVMKAKIDNYQREIFLHPDRKFLLLDFEKRLLNYGIELQKLPFQYLMKLYSEDSDYEPPFGSNFCI